MAAAHPGLGGPRLCLGGNVFGWTIDRDQGFRVLDAFYEGGGRMIDTAEGYSNWVPGNKGGESEAIIGAWAENRGVRAELKIATKVGMEGHSGGLAPAKLAVAIAGSLDRLRTDYVDLYYAHRDDSGTPLDEVAAGFDALVKKGQVRELGASNFSCERLSAAIDAAKAGGFTPYTVLQPGYNLVWRDDFPVDLQTFADQHGIAVLPYYGLASGFLTGKYRSDADFTGARGGGAQKFADHGWEALPVLDAVAEETGTSPAAVALAWLNTQPAIRAPIASASHPEQVTDLLTAARLELSADQVKRLAAVAA